MQCSRCGGHVTWRGPFSNLTHTECASCGGRNCQVVRYSEDEADNDFDDGSPPLDDECDCGEDTCVCADR